EAATPLCAARASIWLLDGETRQSVASSGSAPGWRPAPLGMKKPLSANVALDRAIRSGQTIHMHDMELEGGADRANARPWGIRTELDVPLPRGEEVIGAIRFSRPEPCPFTDQEIALLQTFADQATIAIENTRLFEALEEKGRQLAEASQHKSEF